MDIRTIRWKTATLRAATLAAALAATTALSGTAGAQSIEQLRDLVKRQGEMIKEQARMLEALQNQTIQNKAAVDKVAAAPAKTPDAAVTSGNKNISLEVSGQVNRAVMYADDGERSDVFHVDNDASSTRVRFVGKGQFDEDFSAGTIFEVEFQSNPSNSVAMGSERGIGADNFMQRKLDLFFQSKTFGKLSIGQGDTASNEASEQDLSGTSLAGYVDIGTIGGGFLFRNSATGAPTAVSVGGAFSDLDGLSRDDRLRYDTPSFAGFMLSASAVADGRGDVAASYDNKLGDVAVNAKVAYALEDNKGGSGDRTLLSGSGSVLHVPTGISVTAAAGRRHTEESTRDDEEFIYGKLGYQTKLLSIGTTAVSADLMQTYDFVSDGTEGTAWGVQFVQKIDRIATEAYVGYRTYAFDGGTVVQYDDLDFVIAGARIKF